MASQPRVALNHLILYSANVKAQSEFYRAVLELDPPAKTTTEHIGYQLDTLYLGFEYVKGYGKIIQPGFTPWFTVEDLFAAVGRARGLGAKIRMEPSRRDRGALLAALYDPDGNLFGLHQQGT